MFPSSDEAVAVDDLDVVLPSGSMSCKKDVDEEDVLGNMLGSSSDALLLELVLGRGCSTRRASTCKKEVDRLQRASGSARGGHAFSVVQGGGLLLFIAG